MKHANERPVLRALWKMLAVMALASACAPTARTARYLPDAGEGEVVRVTNHNWSDVVVYLEVSGARHRLGLVPTARTAVFRISSAGRAASSNVRLVVDPVGEVNPFTTDAIPWMRGQDISLSVQSLLSTSYFRLVERQGRTAIPSM